MIEIELPDGNIAEFEDNTSDEVLHRFAQDYINKNNQSSKYIPQMASGEAAGREALDRLSFGAGNKGVAAITAGLLKATGKAGNKSYKDLYNEINQEERKKLQQAQIQHPILTGTVGFGSDLALGIGALEKLGLSGARTYLGKIAQGTVSGAGLGAARGIGTSESPKEILPNVLEEGTKAGLTGGIATAALSPLASLIGKGTNLARNIIKGNTAQNVVEGRLPLEKASIALNKLEESGPEVALADVGGDSIRGLTRSVAKFNNGPKDLVTEALEGRSNAAIERVGNILSKDISGVDTYFGNLDELIAGRKAAATPFYKRAFAKNNKLNIKGNEELFKKIAPELRSVRNEFRIGEEIPDNSLILLDKVKQSLYDKATTLKRQGANNQAKILDDLRIDLTEKLKTSNKDYGKALSIFEDESRAINAQQAGLNFNKLTPEQLKKEFDKLNIAEKEAYRIGARENLQQTINKTAEGADPAKRIFGNTAQRQRLKIILGPKYEAFKTKLLDEIEMANTKFKVLGQSRTDFNVANDADFIDAIAKGAQIASGDRAAITSALTNALKNRVAGLNQKNALEVARILVDKKQGIEALKKIINKQTNISQKRAMRNLIDQLAPSLGITILNNSVEENQ